MFIQEAQEKTDEITAKFLDKEKDPLKYQPTQVTPRQGGFYFTSTWILLFEVIFLVGLQFGGPLKISLETRRSIFLAQIRILHRLKNL